MNNFLIRNGIIYENQISDFIINTNYIKLSLDKQRGYCFKMEYYSNNEKTCAFFSNNIREVISFIEHNYLNNVDIYTYGIPKSFIANILNNLRNIHNHEVLRKVKKVNTIKK